MKEQIRLDINTLRWVEQQAWAYGITSTSSRNGSIRKITCESLREIYRHYMNRQAENPAATVELDSRDFNPDVPAKSLALDEPLTHDDVLKLADKNGYITGVVRVALSEVIENDIEGFLDILSERLLETDMLSELSYRIVGVEDGRTLLVEVYGHVEELDAESRESYIYDVSIQEDANSDPHEYRVEGSTIDQCKAAFDDIILQSIELDGLSEGAVLHVKTVLSDVATGNYIDSDECAIKIFKVVCTEEPSKFVDWSKSKAKPHIFCVDRSKTKWEIVE